MAWPVRQAPSGTGHHPTHTPSPRGWGGPGHEYHYMVHHTRRGCDQIGGDRGRRDWVHCMAAAGGGGASFNNVGPLITTLWFLQDHMIDSSTPWVCILHQLGLWMDVATVCVFLKSIVNSFGGNWGHLLGFDGLNWWYILDVFWSLLSTCWTKSKLLGIEGAHSTLIVSRDVRYRKLSNSLVWLCSF